MALFKKPENNNKEIGFNIIVAAVTLLSPYGEAVGNKLVILDGLTKILKNIQNEAEQKKRYDEIMKIIENISKPTDLEADDYLSIAEALQAEFDKDDFLLHMELCTMESREKLANRIFNTSDKRREVEASYRVYIRQIVEMLSSETILSLLPQSGQVPIEEIQNTRIKLKIVEGEITDLQIQIANHERKLRDHDQRIAELEKDHVLVCRPEEHNEIYREIFQQPLFLENRTDITLEKVYITPMIKDRGCSVTQLIMDWYHSPNAKRCLLLYGDAGVGKTSLIAKIVSDAYRDTDEIEYSFVANEVQTVMLRKKTELFREWYLHSKERNFTDFICALFSVNDIKELQGKLLILDGLDELTVLIPGFKEKARGFIERLCNISVFKRIKILMTSRSNYFDLHLTSMLNLDVQHLSWKQAQTMEWCDKYSKCFEHEEGLVKKTWCDHFKEYYEQLPKDKDDDKRYEIFCIPIILYLACNSGVELDLEQEQTIGKIYDFAFREVALREHIRYHEDNEQLKDSEADQKLRLDHWQYTKELIHQIQNIK